MLFRIYTKLKRISRNLFNKLILYPSFRHVGKNTLIEKTLRIYNPRNISIGNNVNIGQLCWLAAMDNTGNKDAELIIGNGCKIGNFNHIYSTGSIIIEDDVLTADKVYISDNQHGYTDSNIPVYKQPVIQKNHVVIGEGSWLGENVCVIGASIGKHCVIGANSVVTKDIPNYSIAVGSPAKVIKIYNKATGAWIKV